MKSLLTSSSLALGLLVSPASTEYNWTAVDQVLLSAIANQTFPGAAAAVRDSSGQIVYAAAFGNFTYGIPPPASNGTNPPVDWGTTLWDMASCSKIIGPTTTAAYLYQVGLLDIDLLVGDPSLLGPTFASQGGKASVTVRNLLLHDAGLPPDPSPGYDSMAFNGGLGCPATNATHPDLDFRCQDAIFASVLAQPLAHPPGYSYVYSDLSMITMMYVLGTLVHANGLVSPSSYHDGCVDDISGRPGLTRACAYEAYWRTSIKPFLGMPSTQYILNDAYQRGNAMPTWIDSVYRHELVQGYVSDENSYASGGIQGHAGIFATAPDVSSFTAVWGFGYAPPHAAASSDGGDGDAAAARALALGLPAPARAPGQPLLNATTVAYWTTVANATFSPRALGWITQAPTDTYKGCGYSMSNATYYHTGYTGTLMCVDPTRNVTTVLLTNRVYPNSTGNTVGIQMARQMFNDAVIEALLP